MAIMPYLQYLSDSDAYRKKRKLKRAANKAIPSKQSPAPALALPLYSLLSLVVSSSSLTLWFSFLYLSILLFYTQFFLIFLRFALLLDPPTVSLSNPNFFRLCPSILSLFPRSLIVDLLLFCSFCNWLKHRFVLFVCVACDWFWLASYRIVFSDYLLRFWFVAICLVNGLFALICD